MGRGSNKESREGSPESRVTALKNENGREKNRGDKVKIVKLFSFLVARWGK